MAAVRNGPVLLSPLPYRRISSLINNGRIPSRLPSIRLNLRSRSRYSSPFVVSAQSNLFRVVQTALRIGKDVIDTGTNFLPESVPKPIAKVGVGILAVSLSFFLLKSVLSTAFFVLAMMGLIYFLFVAFNSDESSGKSSKNKTKNMSNEDESLEEARRIMEKYK